MVCSSFHPSFLKLCLLLFLDHSSIPNKAFAPKELQSLSIFSIWHTGASLGYTYASEEIRGMFIINNMLCIHFFFFFFQ